jgi:hypothetical protein
MRLALALLAEYALAHQQDGRLYVTGGGIRSLTFPVLPATQARLALALGIEVGKGELGLDHLLAIDASGPTDEVITRPVRVRFRVDEGEPGAAGGYLHFVSNMEAVGFSRPGRYEFKIAIDGQPLDVLPVDVARGGPIPDDTEVTALLGEGYQAFTRGDADSAEAAFRKVTETFPNSADGHNNLGFVLLGRGDASEALDSFAKARELNFVQDEISDANIGAASYAVGEAERALALFVGCLRHGIFRTRATLFGIGPSGLFPVELKSAAEYASLMALNAAWSALKAGNDDAFLRYRAQARASELATRTDVAAGDYTESLRALDAVNRVE